MSNLPPLTEAVLAEARSQGFDRVGVVTDPESEHGRRLREWLEAGHHGAMGYLARSDAVARRDDLRGTLASFASAVVVVHEYGDADPSRGGGDPSTGVIARYARGRDYHNVVAGALKRVGRRLPDLARRPVSFRAYVDTGPILERELARRAGLGWFGKNTMLIHPRSGSYAFLGVLLTDLPLEPSDPFTEDHCGSCARCLDACPTGALLGRDASGAPVMDARLCISYLTIEHRGPIPLELRPLMGNRVFGCDICQEVCPFNTRFAQESSEPGYAARGPGERPEGVEAVAQDNVSAETHPGTDAPPLVALMRMTREEWEAYSRGSAIRRAGYAGFKRNVAVAMGNWLSGLNEPPDAAVAALREAIEADEELVREHAAWALEQAT